MEFSTLFSFFILVGLNLRSLSTAVPNMTLNTTGTSSPYLLFAINSMIWIGVICVQLFFRGVVVGKLSGHPIYQLIDTMSLASISVFIFDRKYRAFYVHGRTVHPFADTDFPELNRNLKREEVSL